MIRFTVKTVVGSFAPVGICTALALVCASGAVAASPWWRVSQYSVPSNLPPGGEGTIVVTFSNLGDAGAEVPVEPVTITDHLPPSVTATSISGNAHDLNDDVRCSLVSLSCNVEGSEAIPSYETLQIALSVKVAAGPERLEENSISVVGGGVSSLFTKEPLRISSDEVGFGVESFEQSAEEEGGASATQAGAHPFQYTTTIELNRRVKSGSASVPSPAGGAVKDLHFVLPQGFVGNPVPLAQCTELQFITYPSGNENDCPRGSIIGVSIVTYESGGAVVTSPVPLYNLVPDAGEPFRFGFAPVKRPVYLDTSLRTGQGYNGVVDVNNITQEVAFLGSQTIFWGVPGDPRHDQARGWACLADYPQIYHEPCVPLGEGQPKPLLTLPTSCTGSLLSTVEGDSWADPHAVVGPVSNSVLDSMDGCNRLSFSPELTVAPDGHAASTPTGLSVEVHVPQEESLTANGLAQSTLRDTTVALPAGVAINPATADGVLTCSLGEVSLEAPVSPSCPEGAKVATVQIKTPLLPDPLEGAAYLAAQTANPFGALVAMYIVAEDPKAGIVVKFAGEVKLDPVTGQLVSTFKGTPQLPFETLVLHFFGGDRAPLSTPAFCGSYTTSASFAPWSGNAPVTSSSSFRVTGGPNGAPCPGAGLPFSPTLAAGTTSIQAGGFSPFTMTISREDGQQNISALQLHMPTGLSGVLSGIELCGEAQADAGTCSANSLIGETTVSVGLGGDPYSVTGGKVYITGPYEGAPFGLSIVVPAKAGPYDLGQVVVRGTIHVDPFTSALTITTDTSGPYAIPHILDGIPLEIKHVNFTTTRTGFTFNPTNCEPSRVTGSVASVEGSSSPVSVPFQVTNCVALRFKPQFGASTSGHTSRSNGASLHVKLAYPKAPFGSQANIKSVKVDLPKQLPSQLKTLQKACPDYTFNANPAACTPESRIGTATAITPVIPVPLSGPVYFVSHASLKFPELVIVLSGYGVTVQLHAETFISKAGITSSTFRTIPDVPVGTFDLTLPQGKYPALAAPDGKLCQDKLTMPTAFTAQNGATIKQNTPIKVEGCPNALQVLGHRVHKQAVSLTVTVPQAGWLTATAKGLTPAAKSATTHQTVTLTLHQRHTGKLHTKIQLRFTSGKGKQRKALHKTITIP